jgi:hypothetical protein
MHWLARAFAAALVAVVACLGLGYLLGVNRAMLPELACFLVGSHLIAVIIYRAGDASETRCRKCGYILRGISEPRCPECGERI